MRISDWSSDVCSSDLGKLRLDSCCGEGGAWLTCVPKTPQQHLGPEDFKQRVLARLGMPMLTRMPSVCKHGTREIFDECVEKLCASTGARLEERRVGNGWSSTCSTWWSAYH